MILWNELKTLVVTLAPYLLLAWLGYTVLEQQHTLVENRLTALADAIDDQDALLHAVSRQLATGGFVVPPRNFPGQN